MSCIVTQGRCRAALVLSLVVSSGLAAQADDGLSSLKPGDPGLKTVGALAFGPQGILFVGDAQGNALVALDTNDRPETRSVQPIKVEGIADKGAVLLGTTGDAVTINDLAVNPASGRVYLSITRGKGRRALPAIVRDDAQGSLEDLDLSAIPFAKIELNDLNTVRRQEAITDLAYLNGKVSLAGLSNEEFASRFRAVPFPFQTDRIGDSTSAEISHAAHNKFETAAPVRTFTTYEIDGEPCLLAAYTCTPLVKFPIKDLVPGGKVRGVTLAELGNRNKPLDLVAYTKDNQPCLLLANSARGVMKVAASEIAQAKPVTEAARGGGTAGLPFETIGELQGVQHLDRLDDTHAVILAQDENALPRLDTILLP